MAFSVMETCDWMKMFVYYDSYGRGGNSFLMVTNESNKSVCNGRDSSLHILLYFAFNITICICMHAQNRQRSCNWTSWYNLPATREFLTRLLWRDLFKQIVYLKSQASSGCFSEPKLVTNNISKMFSKIFHYRRKTWIWNFIILYYLFFLSECTLI